ncbi:hypothetical protein [Aureispira sp. CCB-QB1]|uniref:hypothetical protein n=1 Tax=Aureispira sp. CCB-QB1 TaxID=1313421 RepID=UPI000695CCBB|nr:hypothetical protein [Aureispira sp. CCB-QB1]
MKEPQWICITGTDGAGKSSLIDILLQDTILFNGKKVKEVTIWDLFYLPKEEQHLSISSKQAVDWYLKSLSPQSRTFFLLHCMAQALEIARREAVEIALINAYWYKYLATEVAYDGNLAHRLSLTTSFPKPDLVFSLNVSVKTAGQRKKHYSAFESGFPEQVNTKQFMNFQHKVQAAYQQIMTTVEHIALDGELPLLELKKQILAQLKF